VTRVPGVFGGAARSGVLLQSLERAVRSALPDARVWRRPGSFLAAHSIREADDLYSPTDDIALAADRSTVPNSPPLHDHLAALGSVVQGETPTAVDEPGVIALVDDALGAVVLTSDWSGAFPMYYAVTRDALLFSTLFRPLRNALDAPVDLAGVASFLRYGHHLGDRTLSTGIRRLLPGQVLCYSRQSGRLDLHETSRAWVPGGDPPRSPDEAAEMIWPELVRAMPTSAADLPVALMMSGGWDSRTLLAAALERGGVRSIATYSHGDPFSRELELVRAMSQDAGIPCRIEPIAETSFEPEILAARYARTEAIQFPQWHHAAALLADRHHCVTAGIFGEVVGGHYGPAMLLSGIEKIVAVGASIAGAPWRGTAAEVGDPLSIAAAIPPERIVPWIASSELKSMRGELLGAHGDDIANITTRFRARGIVSVESMVEAFVTENRGAQLISGQLLCMRDRLPIALPFAHRKLLRAAADIPLSLKMHNRLSQRLLRRSAPWLLRYPSAATLVASSTPIILQEASRLARRAGERLRWRLHRRHPARFERPRHGWMNFDFLRTSGTLLQIRRALRSDIWDYRRLDERLSRFAAGNETISASSLAEALLRAYTVELALQ